VAKKRYYVTAHTPVAITLKETGKIFGGEVVTLQRAGLTITEKLTHWELLSSAGVSYYVNEGVRAEQRALTKAAFGVA
jgi:hypothetical protein